MISAPDIFVAVVCASAVGSAVSAFLSYRVGLRTAVERAEKVARDAVEEWETSKAIEFGRLRDQLKEPVDWVIIGTREPGLGVVITVGQEPVKFDMLRRMEAGKWQPGPLGAKLPVYKLVFNGQTDNFEQIRADTYESALGKLMARRA